MRTDQLHLPIFNVDVRDTVVIDVDVACVVGAKRLLLRTNLNEPAYIMLMLTSNNAHFSC